MKKVVVKVTKKHIREGLKRSCISCPVALALTEALGKTAEVGYSTWGFPSSMLRWNVLPGRVSGWILAFDQGFPMEPFQFTISPQDYVKD